MLPVQNHQWNLGNIWDLNNDGCANIIDLALIGRAFGKRRGEAGYNIEADRFYDGVINTKDLTIISRSFGEGC